MDNFETLIGTGPGSLSRALDFDHIIYVGAAGQMNTQPKSGLYSPEEVDAAPYETSYGDWTLITSGLTGQDRYNGPWLHDSEQIEGGVARRVLEHAAENGGGYYVAVYGQHSCIECGGAGLLWNNEGTEEVECPNVACEPGYVDFEGWTIAYRPTS